MFVRAFEDNTMMVVMSVPVEVRVCRIESSYRQQDFQRHITMAGLDDTYPVEAAYTAYDQEHPV